MKKNILKSLFIIGAMFGVVAATTPALGVTCPGGTKHASETKSSYAECNTEDTNGDDGLMSRVRVIIEVVIGILGVVAVAMIILGGIQYATSQGNPEQIKKAKDIILYAVIGLIVALLAFAIVDFVLGNVFN